MQVSEDDLSLLASKFSAAHPSGREGAGGAEEGEEEEEAGGKESETESVDYDAFVRWMSEGVGLDDALLGKVQRHLKARLSK